MPARIIPACFTPPGVACHDVPTSPAYQIHRQHRFDCIVFAYGLVQTAEPFKRAPGDPPSIIIEPGKQFAADSYVHKPLPPDAPLEEHSADYVKELQRQIKAYYGTVNVNVNHYMPAVYQVPANVPTVRVRVFDKKKPDWTFKPLQAQWENVPLPENFQAASGTDMEAVVYQPSTGKYWEFWQMQKTGAKVCNFAGVEVDEWGWCGAATSKHSSKKPRLFPHHQGRLQVRHPGHQPGFPRRDHHHRRAAQR
ncbi:MAG: hypothetical protein QM767_28060 [Anaeromyxobacter sp.]